MRSPIVRPRDQDWTVGKEEGGEYHQTPGLRPSLVTEGDSSSCTQGSVSRDGPPRSRPWRGAETLVTPQPASGLPTPQLTEHCEDRAVSVSWSSPQLGAHQPGMEGRQRSVAPGPERGQVTLLEVTQPELQWQTPG